jgi:protein-S-isoprenylcysteine O-methyltransferase Ste14
MDKLAKRAILGVAQFVIGLGVLLFAVAGTLDFWQAWVYLFIFGASSALITAYLWKNDPRLLERRMNAGPGAEKEKSQRRIQLFAFLAFIAVHVLSSLDHRFSWSDVPLSVVIAGEVLVALGLLAVFVVFKENTFAAATVQVASDQKVVSTGLYARVRHPMYSGALVMLLGAPLALGSWWGLLMFVPLTVIIVWRLLDEEKFLARNLSGYSTYCRRVQYRLIPSVW